MTTPLRQNILDQPAALRAVADYQLGPGLAQLQHCAELLRNSKHIVVSGMGASLFACIPMRYALARRGLTVSVIETAELLHFLDPLLVPDTTLVLVSRSGESVETLKLLDRMSGRRFSTIGITNVPDSSLARGSDEHLLLNSPADQLVAVQSYVASVVTLGLLGAAASNELSSAEAELMSAITHLEPWVVANFAYEEHGRSFIERRSSLYILSRGPGLASVDEGVLLMHEVAKTPATGMSVAQFRHGFVEAADNDIRVVILGTQPATWQIDHQFGLDLARMGAAVSWIGPVPSGSALASAASWPPEVPVRFASLFEIVPLQLLAYRMAEARGIVPGTFRWAATVTASETGFPLLQQ